MKEKNTGENDYIFPNIEKSIGGYIRKLNEAGSADEINKVKDQERLAREERHQDVLKELSKNQDHFDLAMKRLGPKTDRPKLPEFDLPTDKSQSLFDALKAKIKDPVALQEKLAEKFSEQKEAFKKGISVLSEMYQEKRNELEGEEGFSSDVFEDAASETSPPLPPQQVSEEISSKKPVDSSVERTNSNADLINNVVVSNAVLEQMENLLNSMKTEQKGSSFENSWDRLEHVTSEIRKAWVATIARKDGNRAAGTWLDEWESIVLNFNNEAKNFAPVYQNKWMDWSKKTTLEIQSLRPLFKNNETTNDVNCNNTSLMVPASFKNKGVVPTASKSVPAQLVSDLQNCADYWEYIQSKGSKFFWKNTPAKHAMDEAKTTLQEWEPIAKKDIEWKDRSLKRYEILEGRLTVLSESSDDAPVAKKDKKKSL